MSDATSSDVGIPTAPPATAPTQTYDASCHCGAFKYSVTASPPLDDPNAVVMECNCSICVCNGYLFIYVPNERVVFSNGNIDQFKVSKAYAPMERYFNTRSELTLVYSLTLSPPRKWVITSAAHAAHRAWRAPRILTSFLV